MKRDSIVPYVKLNTKEFYIKTIGLTMEETGWLITLLCFQVKIGHMSEHDIKSICLIDDINKLSDVLKWFKIDSDGLYFNEDFDSQINHFLNIKKHRVSVAKISGSLNKASNLNIQHDLWIEMVDFFNNTCVCCERCFPDGEYPTVDHIIPKSLGGTDDISNLQPLCKRCNSSKNNSHSTDYRKKYYNTIPDRLRETWFPKG